MFQNISAYYFKFTDHTSFSHSTGLDSITAIVNEQGNIIEEQSFDACSVKLGFWKRSATKPLVELILDCEANREGRFRNPNDWTYNNISLSSITDRGYTGHKHMTAFSLINMNGRVYDPYTSQFLSPDPFIQDPANPQNYNRYSYVLNNPLKFTDQSGYNYGNNADGGYIYYDWLSYWENQWLSGNWTWSLLDYAYERMGEVNDFFKSQGISGIYITRHRLVDAEPYYSELAGTSMESNTPFLARPFSQIPEFYLEFAEFDEYISHKKSRRNRKSENVYLKPGFGESDFHRYGFCGQCHNPNGHLYNDPGIVEMRKTRLIPDLISVDVNLGSTFVAGASMTYSINFVTRGEPGIYLTRTEQERFGLEVDWGFNANIAYYNGDPANINKQLLAGPINSISGGFIYGGQNFEASDYSWVGVGGGIGLNFGGSYGRGKTYLGWW